MLEFCTIPTVNMTYTDILDRKTTQLWWLTDMGCKHLKSWLLCCCFCCCHLIFLSYKCTSFIIFDKWFVQIYLHFS